MENARICRGIIVVLDGTGCAQDVGHTDPLPLARKLIAAARTAHAVKDAFVHQSLQHRLEMA